MSAQRITLLGCTGSIGSSTLKLVAQHRERYSVEALVAGNNAKGLIEQALAFQPKLAVIRDKGAYAQVKEALSGKGIEVLAGEEAVLEAAQRKADFVMAAIVGMAGLKPTLEAVRQGTKVGLANKESLVAAGELLMREAQTHGTTLLPVDSEHSALFQVFADSQVKQVEKVTITASGGPFRHFTQAQMQKVTPEQAVKHPNWNMGAKISVDSATMMNKGLEVIEAARLFPLKPEQIEVLIHPESIIHGMVHYADGSVLAQMSPPDMCTPIAVAMAWPERMQANTPKLDLARLKQLTFELPDAERFPALKLASEALKADGAAPILLNASNEVAVAAFLEGRIGFLDITRVIAQTVEEVSLPAPASLADVFSADAAAREKANSLIARNVAHVA